VVLCVHSRFRQLVDPVFEDAAGRAEHLSGADHLGPRRHGRKNRRRRRPDSVGSLDGRPGSARRGRRLFRRHHGIRRTGAQAEDRLTHRSSRLRGRHPRGHHRESLRKAGSARGGGRPRRACARGLWRPRRVMGHWMKIVEIVERRRGIDHRAATRPSSVTGPWPGGSSSELSAVRVDRNVGVWLTIAARPRVDDSGRWRAPVCAKRTALFIGWNTLYYRRSVLRTGPGLNGFGSPGECEDPE